MTVPWFDFGKPYASDGETRPRFFRTPLAWVDGHEGGIVYVRTGSQTHLWMLVSDWQSWLCSTNAKPIEAVAPVEPFFTTET